MQVKRGLFITFEGIDGCGKSTQFSLLAEYLFKVSKYNHLILTREPYKEMKIREILNQGDDPKSQADKLCELFINDRRAHVSEIISPNLEAGLIILSDRYKLSTIAYQTAQGMNMLELIKKHKDMPIPELTFIIDLPANLASERMAKDAGRKKHKLEKDIEFLERVRENFLKAKEVLSNERIFIIDGSRKPEQIFADIQKIVDKVLIQRV